MAILWFYVYNKICSMFITICYELWEKMMKEVKEKRFAGPYKWILFDNYVQSPVGLVPKDERWKIIVLFYSFVIKGKMEKAQNPFMTMGDIFLAHRHKIRWKYMIWKLCLCSAVEVCKVITFLIANLSIWYYDRAFSGMLSYIFFRMLDIVKNYTEGILGFV